jgi:hypothetical protein
MAILIPLLILIVLFTLYIIISKRISEGFQAWGDKEIYVGKKSFTLGNKTIPFTDPDLIKMVLNQNDYTPEKKMVSYTEMPKAKNSPRFFLDENRHNYIEDIPFAPHIILKSYDDVDVSQKVKFEEEIDNIDKIDVYDEKTFENNDDYCIKNKHLLECILAERNYKCFGKIEFTKKECEAETDIIGNRVSPGVWDRRCLNDVDCPFYKANKNYPNTFGKCTGDGYCELPKGLVKMGYRKYAKNSLPYCYNCIDQKTGKKIVDKCCDKQKNPDYVFDNDIGIRYKYRKLLEEKGLLTSTNDIYDKEFSELEKKLKI